MRGRHTPTNRAISSVLRTGGTGRALETGMIRYYHWLHIPTGVRGVSRYERAASRREFLEALDRWNAQQAGTWQYWTAVNTEDR